MAETWQVWDAELGYSHTSLMEPRAVELQTVATGAEPLWGVHQVKPDGTAHIHIFPHNTLEWRCAEYGIDHEDLDTLLAVILHEPWIPAPDDPLVWQDEAALAIVQETADLPTCWTPGVSDETRLQAHLARISAVQQHRVQVEDAPRRDRQAALQYVGSRRVADPAPLDPIRSTARLDPVRIQGRHMAVQWRRSSLQAPTFASKPPSTFVGNFGMQPATRSPG